MKYMRMCIAVLSVFLLISGLAWTKDKSTVAVLPFSVHSAENIDYVQQGIWSMLSTRITADGKIDVVNKESVVEALKEKGGKDLTLTDVYAVGKKMQVDYMVWGSITKIGNNLSIDGKLVDIAAYKSAVDFFTQSQGMDEVIPKISDFAQRIHNHILGITPSTVAAAQPPILTPVPTQQPPPPVSRESEIIAGMRKSTKGTFTSVINPDFINAFQPVDRRGFWMSEKLPLEIKGMDIGDVNGDGLNEIVVITDRAIRIYQKKGKEFKLLYSPITEKSADRLIAVDVADINKKGIAQIFVSALSGNTVNSFVLEWKDGKFVTIAKNLRWLFRVIDKTDRPLLLGQNIRYASKSADNQESRPFETPIHEIVWDNGTYRESQKMRIPVGLSIYGLALDTLEIGGNERIIALNEEDYLCIYEETDKSLAKLQVFGGTKELLYKSDDPYGGSNSYIEAPDSANLEVYMNKTYLNTRILTYDINKKGKKEIIIVKNLSSAGRVLKNVKLFTASEIYDLEWDGLGLLENWKTRKINGYVADYQFKDVDNDGEKEIVMALVTSTGISFGDTSVLVAYKMAPPPETQQTPPRNQ